MTYRRLMEPPLLILVDMQREYVAGGRPLSVEGAAGALENCHRLLSEARRNSWLIAHCFTRGEGALFARNSEFARPIDGFQPHRSELVFFRTSLSAYGSEVFADQMQANHGAPALIAGLSASFSILATLYDAFSHRHAVALVQDATAAAQIGGASSTDVLRVSLEIAAMIAPLTTTDQVCGETPRQTRELESSCE